MTIGALKTVMKWYGYSEEHTRIILSRTLNVFTINNNCHVHPLRMRNIFRDFPVTEGLSNGE